MKTLRKLLSKDQRIPTYLAAALILGVVLMLVSGPLFRRDGPAEPGYTAFELSSVSESHQNAASLSASSGHSEHALERRLEEALSLVDGVGLVKVMLTFTRERETVFVVDRNINNSVTQEQDAQGGTRYQSNQQSQDNTLIISDRPLVVTETPPVIGGVLIIAEGGDNVLVRDALLRATSTLLGIEINRVQVLTKSQ